MRLFLYGILSLQLAMAPAVFAESVQPKKQLTPLQIFSQVQTVEWNLFLASLSVEPSEIRPVYEKLKKAGLTLQSPMMKITLKDDRYFMNGKEIKINGQHVNYGGQTLTYDKSKSFNENFEAFNKQLQNPKYSFSSPKLWNLFERTALAADRDPDVQVIRDVEAFRNVTPSVPLAVAGGFTALGAYNSTYGDKMGEALSDLAFSAAKISLLIAAGNAGEGQILKVSAENVVEGKLLDQHRLILGDLANSIQSTHCSSKDAVKFSYRFNDKSQAVVKEDFKDHYILEKIDPSGHRQVLEISHEATKMMPDALKMCVDYANFQNESIGEKFANAVDWWHHGKERDEAYGKRREAEKAAKAAAANGTH